VSKNAEEDRNQIVVEEDIIFEVKARSAVLQISVKGSSYIADDMALKKAREVSTLVDALKEMGISQTDIRLKNVVADAQTGLVTKTSSAKYFMSVKIIDLDKLSEALSVVTSSKNCELHKLSWQFDEERALRLDYIAKAFAAARESAECVARTLGVNIEGIYDASYIDFVVPDDYIPNMPSNIRRSAASLPADSLERARGAAPAPALPTGQWQRKCIRAHVVFAVGKCL